MKRKIHSCASEGRLALLFCAKDDKIPSLLVINSITTAYLKLLLSGGFQTQPVRPGSKIVPATNLLDIFVVLSLSLIFSYPPFNVYRGQMSQCLNCRHLNGHNLVPLLLVSWRIRVKTIDNTAFTRPNLAVFRVCMYEDRMCMSMHALNVHPTTAKVPRPATMCPAACASECRCDDNSSSRVG